MKLGLNLRRADQWIDQSPVGRLVERLKGRLVSAQSMPLGQLDRVDRYLAFLLGVVAVFISSWTMRVLPRQLYRDIGANIWFQADMGRVITLLTSREDAMHYRDSVHPLFSILAYPLSKILRTIGLSPVDAGNMLILACGFLTLVLLYANMRLMGMLRWPAFLCCAVFLSSATYLHWFGLVETYPFAAVTGLFCIWVFLRKPQGSLALLAFASAGTLAITVTNWVLGLAIAGMTQSLSRFLKVTIVALIACMILANVQQAVFPAARLFYNGASISDEKEFVLPESGRITPYGEPVPIARIRTVWLSSAIAPKPYGEGANLSGTPIITNQYVSTRSYGVAGWIGVASWILALLLAMLGLVLDRKVSGMLVAIMAYMVSETVLHVVYGELTFLYSANFFPMLMIMVGMGTATRFRTASIAALAGVLIAGGINNLEVFLAATHAVPTAG